jgi:hypothetical protein
LSDLDDELFEGIRDAVSPNARQLTQEEREEEAKRQMVGCSDNKVGVHNFSFPSNKRNNLRSLMVRQGSHRLKRLRCPWFESCGVPFLSLERRFFLLARF